MSRFELLIGLYRYVEAYRRHGYKFANLNPVSLTEPVAGSELDCARYGLTPSEAVVTQDQGEVTVSRLAEVRNPMIDASTIT